MRRRSLIVGSVLDVYLAGIAIYLSIVEPNWTVGFLSGFVFLLLVFKYADLIEGRDR